jgi:hypothetical protein
LCEPKGYLDIIVLCAFFAAGEQDHNLQAALYEMHAIPRPEVNPHFRNPFANRLTVAEVTSLGAVNAGLNPSRSLLVTQGFKPIQPKQSTAPRSNKFESYRFVKRS